MKGLLLWALAASQASPHALPSLPNHHVRRVRRVILAQGACANDMVGLHAGSRVLLLALSVLVICVSEYYVFAPTRPDRRSWAFGGRAGLKFYKTQVTRVDH